MSHALLDNSRPYPRLRRFAIDVAITQVFNVVIALLVTYAIRVPGGFYVSLLISICVGTLAVTLIDGGRLLLWGLNRVPKLPFIVLAIVSMPVAQYFGNRIAALITGIPAANFAAVRTQYMTAFLVGSSVSFIAIIWFFWSREHIAHLAAEAEAEKARAAAIERQAIQAQLQMLQAQIEPHMLFNTLANLQGLIAVDPQRAQNMLEQLIQYLRATLSSSRAERTTLAHEFTLMDAYLGLMKVRMGARLRYALQLPEDLRPIMVPPMLLQPLVENAIKHGLEPKVDGGEITIRAERDAGMLTLNVTDTGLGLDAGPSDPNGTHIGVTNIRERLQALYGDRATFRLIPNTPSGVIAQLSIPL